MTVSPITVAIPWQDVRAALDLLQGGRAAAFQARPVGNRVVIDCEEDADAQRLLGAFKQARLVQTV